MLKLIRKAVNAVFAFFVPDLSGAQREWFSNRKAKEAVAFFIEYCRAYERKLYDISSDHEDDEIPTAMITYEKMIGQVARVSVCAHPFTGKSTDELKIDNLPKQAVETMFFDSLEYAQRHERIFSNTSSRNMLMEFYIKAFGPPTDVKARILKAEVSGDEDLVRILRSCSC